MKTNTFLNVINRILAKLFLLFFSFKKTNGVYNHCNWSRYICFSEKLVFPREKYIIFSILFVISYYLTCIAHLFHINGIFNKTYGRVSLFNSYNSAHTSTGLKIYIYERSGVHFSLMLNAHINMIKKRKEKMYLVALVF